MLAFSVGRYPVSLGDLFNALYASLTGHRAAMPQAVASVIFEVRGPRVLAAAMIGATLAVAGTAFQNLQDHAAQDAARPSQAAGLRGAAQ